MAHSMNSLEVLCRFLGGSFPALHFVQVVCLSIPDWDEGFRERPWLHAIALGHPNPGTLRTIVLQRWHGWEDEHGCCDRVVGTSEEVVGTEKRLPELLLGLRHLVIRLYGSDPGKCAAYIWSVLPGMRNVLRFMHGAPGKEWTPYTLPLVTQ